MEIFNLFHGELDEGPEGGEPPGYELGRAVRVGRKVGAPTATRSASGRVGSTPCCNRRSAHLDDWDGER